MIRITPFRLITLQCSQIGFTLLRTFTAGLLIQRPPAVRRCGLLGDRHQNRDKLRNLLGLDTQSKARTCKVADLLTPRMPRSRKRLDRHSARVLPALVPEAGAGDTRGLRLGAGHNGASDGTIVRPRRQAQGEHTPTALT